VSVLQQRKIADDNLALVHRHLRSEGAFAAAKQTVERVEQEFVGHAGPGHLQRGPGTLVEYRPFLEDVLRREVQIAPLIGRKRLLPRLDRRHEFRTKRFLLPCFLLELAGMGGQRLNDPVDIGDRDALALSGQARSRARSAPTTLRVKPK
jgi:hypothetical protein